MALNIRSIGCRFGSRHVRRKSAFTVVVVLLVVVAVIGSIRCEVYGDSMKAKLENWLWSYGGALRWWVHPRGLLAGCGG